MLFSTKSRVLLAIALGLAISSSGCGYQNTFKAEQARTSLVGMSELELESCVGLPDKEATKGKTTLLVYNAPNATTINLSVPIVNGSACRWRAIAARPSGLRTDRSRA
jgi:hypothetical protein